MRFRSSRRWRRGILGLGVLTLILAVACSASATPSTTRPTESIDEILTTPPSSPESSPRTTPTPRPTGTAPAAAPSPTPVPSLPDPSNVPPVNLEVHSVPLEDVVFDTFDGSYVSLREAAAPRH